MALVTCDGSRFGLVWLRWLLADFGVYVSMPSLLSILVLMSITHENEHTLNSVCLIHLEFEGGVRCIM